MTIEEHRPMHKNPGRIEVWLIAIAVLAVSAACGVTYWNIVADKELTRATGIKVADTLAASLEEHVNETLRDAANAAYSAALLIENAGGVARFSPARLHQELQRELFDTTSTARLIAADAAGRVVASSAEYPLPAISIADSASFRWHTAHPAERGLHLGVSRASPIDGKFAIPYSRAIYDARGAVGGVVMAEIGINYLRGFHETLTSIYPASITVFNREGVVLMRLPYDEKFMGGRISSAARLEQIFKGSGSIELTSVIDGVARYFSYRPSKLHPLAVGVGLEKEHIMAPWVARSEQRALVVGCGSLIFLGLVALLVAYLRRLQRSEEMLRISESRLRSLSDNLPNSVVYQAIRESDGRMNFLYFSAGIERLNGLSAETVLREPALLYAQIIEEDRQRVAAAGQAAFDSMSVFNVVARMRRADGELRSMQLCSAPHRLPDGRTLWDGIQTDITERVDAEQLLERERTLLKTLVDHLPDEVYTLNAQGQFTLVNPAWLATRGFASSADVVGKTVFDVFDHELAARLDAENRRIVEAGVDFCDQSRQFVNADGTRRYVSVNKVLMRNGRGEPIGIVGINRDITEVKNAIERISYERNLLHSIIDIAPDTIVVKDRACRYVIMNQAALDLCGVKNHDEAVGKTAYDFFPADTARVFEAEDRAVMDSGRPLIDFQRRARNPGADGRWMSIYKFPRFDADGNVNGMISISRDITRIQAAVEEVHRLNLQLEDRVRMRTQELQEANKELEAFSYSVSHDLRAPLRSVLGFGNFLLKDNIDQLDAEGRSRLQRILAAGQRMGELIDDLLNLSRISRVAIARSAVNLSNLAQELVAVLAEGGAQRHVAVVIAPDLEVDADRGLMRIALDNLLANAWKFTGKQGNARIEVGAAQVEGQLAYFVRDNGAGFDMAYAGKLFAPFQRMHTAQEFEGTGIGLATVKRIIQRHHGRIWVESAVDSGTTVYFTVGGSA
jgi:PAS domain S-box-containing protein